VTFPGEAGTRKKCGQPTQVSHVMQACEEEPGLGPGREASGCKQPTTWSALREEQEKYEPNYPTY